MKKSVAQYKAISFDSEWHSIFIDWISANKKIILWSSLTFLISLLLATRFFSSRNSNAENDFFLAQKIYNEFQQKNTFTDSPSDFSNFDQLIAIIERHPEVKPRYEGFLAQSLILSGQASKAQILTKNIFDRSILDNLKLYHEYSEASLMMTEEKYSEALAKTLQLHMVLDKSEKKFFPILHIYNLIRLALLYQLTGQPEKELATWEIYQSQSRNIEPFISINNSLNIGQATLSQFIEERIKLLKS